MAVFQFPLLFPATATFCYTAKTGHRHRLLPSCPKIKVCVSSQMLNRTTTPGEVVVRRTANYKPPIWKYELLQSLTSEFKGETYVNRIEMLKKVVREMLVDDEKMKKVDCDHVHVHEQPLMKKLELIDTLQRLGLSYHFGEEIKKVLENYYDQIIIKKVINNSNNGNAVKDLYSTALEFRILRQHGYHVPQEVFNDFKDEIENFSAYSGCESEKAKGMLCLYEASYLAREGESILDNARNFAHKNLEKLLKTKTRCNNIDEFEAVRHALEIPFHWRVPRLETRWFIDIYESRKLNNKIPILLELAKLDFNLVQSTHQDELKYVSRWWRSIGLGDKLEFARDRLMSNFFWTVGIGFEPKFGKCRRMLTKIASLITIIDDVYDVYGTLDELHLFTHAVERWDVDAIDELPNYMKISFLALHNTINDMAFEALKDQEINVVQYLKKMWVDLCKTFLVEAKWYYTNYKPTFQEYLDNAWISVSGPLILVHAYVFSTTTTTIEALENLKYGYHDIIRHSSTICRLLNDLATSSDEVKRGDSPKSLQCYMNDTGASESEARVYMKNLISETWKKMNGVDETCNNSSYFSHEFHEMAFNLARISHIVYQNRDGHTMEDHEAKERILSLFIKPI